MGKAKDYYVGLDIGTSSVGWAVTDENYNIPKFNSKKMWGTYTFQAAQTAEGRRTYRTSRRRLDRRKERINLLQDLFAEELVKVDSNFFLRLANSDLYREDKDEKLKSKYTLFNDKDFKDKDYHKKYPTIHHLIMDLIEDDSKKDIRLVYLACHYLIKNRGHFIFEGQKFDSKNSLENSLHELQIHLIDEYDTDIEFDNEKMIKILTNSSFNKTQKKKEFEKLLGKDKFIKAICATMIGSSQALTGLFPADESLKEADIKKVDFSTSVFEEQYDDYESLLGDKIDLLNILKRIYDASILENLLVDSERSKDGNKYISQSFVAKYNKHGADLKELKRLIKKYLRSDYNEIFRDENVKGNYVSYSKSNITKNKRTKATEYTSENDFYTYIKKKLNSIKNNSNISEADTLSVDKMLEDITTNTFMPKLKSSVNGVIPYQLKLEQLQKILDNQSAHYQFLNETDDYGLVKDKIISIMTFKIPYYVGPLNPESEFAWVVRKSQQITPWNFEDVVDLDSSRQAFFDRLVGRCTFLKQEKVLPKSSLLYSEFMVLNELNNLKLNSMPIDATMKELIFEELFKKQKKVTLKAVANLLKKEFNITDEILLTGTDGDFKQGLNSYIDFRKIIGDKVDRDDYRKVLEEIIRLIVLYEEDKKYLEKKIKSGYKDYFTDNEIKKISKLNYKEWGRLSQKLLNQIEGVDKETGEVGTVIHFMRNYNLNLMELMSGSFTFNEVILEFNPIDDRKLSYDMVDELYLSPSVKRMLWQSLKIVDEIRKIKGTDPKKIFIEMARSNEEKGVRKESRKEQIKNFYKDGKKAFISEIGADRYNELLNSIEKEEASKFRWDNLYLYYTQLGRCMYSMEKIELSDLSAYNIYDQDHIYPKSKIYDDSIENRVLVKKDLNTDKGNQYPIPQHLLNKKCFAYWKILYDKGLIGKKKYSRLIRQTPFTEEELVQFIERQIVETRQATKETANLLKAVCKNSEIVYSKAANASRFRQQFDIVKCRTVNDLHHMHDAYINIVVGNVYNTKFTKDPRNFIKNAEKGRSYNLENMFKYDVVRGNQVAWIADSKDQQVENATIKTVKKELSGRNFRFTQMSYIETGELFNATRLRKGKGTRSLKDSGPKSSIEKYGGYTNVNKAYFIIVDIPGKKKTERKILPIEKEIYLKQQSNPEKADIYLKEYFKDRFNIDDFNVVCPMVKMKSLLKINGFYYFITGGTNKYIELSSAVQLMLPKKSEWAIKQIDKSSLNQYRTLDRINGLTEELVDNTFECIIDKLQTSIYSNSFLEISKKVDSAKAKFEKLNYQEKCEVILKLVKAISSSGSRQDLKMINLSGTYGRISGKSNNINNYDEFKIINQSITGLFENEVDLINL